jgi:chemotaxis protein histidine kinase CheA
MSVLIASLIAILSMFLPEQACQALSDYLKTIEERISNLENASASAKKGRPKKASKDVVCKGPECDSETESEDPFKKMIDENQSQSEEEAKPKAKRVYKKKVAEPVEPADAEEPAPKAKRVYKKKVAEPAPEPTEQSEPTEPTEPASEPEEPTEPVPAKPKAKRVYKKKEESEEPKAVKCIRINEEGKKVTKAYKGKIFLKGDDNFIYNEDNTQIGKWNETDNKIELFTPQDEFDSLVDDEEEPENYDE